MIALHYIEQSNMLGVKNLGAIPVATVDYQEIFFFFNTVYIQNITVLLLADLQLNMIY